MVMLPGELPEKYSPKDNINSIVFSFREGPRYGGTNRIPGRSPVRVDRGIARRPWTPRGHGGRPCKGTFRSGDAGDRSRRRNTTRKTILLHATPTTVTETEEAPRCAAGTEQITSIAIAESARIAVSPASHNLCAFPHSARVRLSLLQSSVRFGQETRSNCPSG